MRKEESRNSGFVTTKSRSWDRLPALAAELVQSKVDIIAAAGTAGIRAAQRATSTIPIVFVILSDPVAGAVQFGTVVHHLRGEDVLGWLECCHVDETLHPRLHEYGLEPKVVVHRLTSPICVPVTHHKGTVAKNFVTWGSTTSLRNNPSA
jgi:hypothetical protein